MIFLKITLKAYAKVNLLLDVTGTKQNGYHSLFTIMQSVGVYDIVTVEKTKGDKIVITCTDPSVPVDSANIVYKCAMGFFEHAGIYENRGLAIHIEKNIPTYAGLGGGSADGAAVLVALNEIFDKGYNKRRLCGIGVKVSADIPFCIVGGTSLAQDIGGVVAALPDIDDCFIVIVKPVSGVSTKDAYSAIDNAPEIRHTHDREMLETLLDGSFFDAVKYCDNVFEQVVEIPGRVDIKHTMRENNSLAACMAGSGSSVFGIFNKESDAVKCQVELKKKYEDVFLCHPQKHGVEVISAE